MRRALAPSTLLLTFVCVTSALGQSAPVQRDGRGTSAVDPPRPTATLPRAWWRDGTIAAQVGLTRAQIDRIETVFEDFLKPQRDRWDAFRPLEKELNDLLQQPHADEKQVIDLITGLEARRSEMTRNRLIMLFHIQQVLNPSQRAKLRHLGWSVSGSPRP